MCVLDRASYPVRVRGVGPREDVQQVVPIPGHCDAAFVVDGAVSAAGGAFVTLLAKKEQITWFTSGYYRKPFLFPFYLLLL